MVMSSNPLDSKTTTEKGIPTQIGLYGKGSAEEWKDGVVGRDRMLGDIMNGGEGRRRSSEPLVEAGDDSLYHGGGKIASMHMLTHIGKEIVTS